MKENWTKIFSVSNDDQHEENINNIGIAKIQSNPYQPRKIFDPDKIKELAQSIKTYGLIQPIILRTCDTCYQIIAGERRFLACKELGWSTIPSIIKDISESGMAAVALIENLQRENLHYLEEAQGYQRLLDDFGLTQEVLAQRLGKSQSTIANKLRLLKLKESIREYVVRGNLTERHTRALLKLPEEQLQENVVNIIVEEDLNVKETEILIEEILEKMKENKKPKKSKKVVVRDLRIFLNTIRQAIKVIKKAGLNPIVFEKDCEKHFEILIRFPKEMD
ncbi:MAG: nucleoid occlusion protein [Firmicutes bacterium HGW-Firmicutes-13]|nr:MAG: nucleoid occlusion protein [Firmicutes bacterium HGW-Firmicutes-13]